MIDTPLYIACLRLEGREAVVVGGGPIAAEKVSNLLLCRANVRVVAPEVNARLRDLAAGGAITWTARTYEAPDLDGAFLVIAATDDMDVNRRVFADADARAMLVNVVDVPELCSFILPAIVRNGPLAIAISTAGASPALAKRMKREIAEHYGEPYARLAEILDGSRAWAREALPTYEARRAFFEGIVNGSPDPIDLLRRGDEAAVLALVEDARAGAMRT